MSRKSIFPNGTGWVSLPLPRDKHNELLAQAGGTLAGAGRLAAQMLLAYMGETCAAGNIRVLPVHPPKKYRRRYVPNWQRHGQPDSDCVYFVRGCGLIKIGYSSDIDNRLQGLFTDSPAPLKLLATIPGGREVESAWHRRLKQSRAHGEWFEEIATMAAMRAAGIEFKND